MTVSGCREKGRQSYTKISFLCQPYSMRMRCLATYNMVNLRNVDRNAHEYFYAFVSNPGRTTICSMCVQYYIISFTCFTLYFVKVVEYSIVGWMRLVKLLCLLGYGNVLPKRQYCSQSVPPAPREGEDHCYTAKDLAGKRE